MKLKFWKKRPPTPEENLITSFNEEGRWEKVSATTWRDVQTLAVAETQRMGLYINNVHQPMEVSMAFFEMLFKPIQLKAQQDRKAVEDLYANHS